MKLQHVFIFFIACCREPDVILVGWTRPRTHPRNLYGDHWGAVIRFNETGIFRGDKHFKVELRDWNVAVIVDVYTHYATVPHTCATAYFA